MILGENAFINQQLENIYIPKTVKIIEKNCFNSDKLETVFFEGEVPLIDVSAFECLCGATIFCDINYKNEFYNVFSSAIGNDCTIKTFGKLNTKPVKTAVEIKKEVPIFDFESNQNGGYTLVRYNGDEENVVIPAEFMGKPVTKIGFEALYTDKRFSNIKSVVVPDSVTEIDDWAFYRCFNMETIVLSKNLVKIGENAFQNCDALKEINLGAKVQFIEDMAFSMCESLEKINVSSENEFYKDIDGVLFDKSGKILINYPSGKLQELYKVPVGTEIIKNDSFRLHYTNNTCALKKVYLPSSLKEIGQRAFMQSSIELIEYKKGVKVGNNAYDGCKNAKTVNIDDGVTEISDGALSGLEKCENIVLPESLQKIGRYSFERLGAKNVLLPSSLKTICNNAFENSNLENVIIPSSLSEIGRHAFYLSSVKSIDFSLNSVLSSISDYCFSHCPALSTVKLNNVFEVSEGAFSYCYSLTNISLPKTLEAINSFAFAGSGIKEISIPNSVKLMGEGVFRDCYELKSARLSSNANISKNTFDGCHKLEEVVSCKDNSFEFSLDSTKAKIA